MPHKKFQHFLKWVDILSEPKQIYRKRKERLNRKKENPYLSPRRGRPTQPSRPTGAAGSSSPPRASKLLGGMPPSQPWTTRRRRGPSRPPRASFSRLETPWSTPPPFPPPELLPLLLRSNSSPPEASPECTAVDDVATVP